MTHDDKLYHMMRGAWFDDDEFLERLARKLSADDVKQLVMQVDKTVEAKLRWFCQSLMKMPTQRERLAEVSRKATEPKEPS